MSRVVTPFVLVGMLAFVAAARPAVAQIELADEGRTLVYRMQPGDTPFGAAARLGLSPEDASALLAEQGVRDATRVAPGFTFRVPNPLAAEVDRLQAAVAESAREEAEAEARADRLEREVEGLRQTAGWSAAQRARLALLERNWALATMVVLGMALLFAVSLVVTVAALRLRKRAASYADDLARDLEAKRAVHLAERQRTGKELIALEERVRELEGQLRIQAQAS